MLANVRIVLVNPTHPGNIGAAARAMKVMCLERLVLVQPRLFPSAEATALASGADDLLARARVCDTLDAAIESCRLVIGASARVRNLRWPQIDVREAAAMVARQPEADVAFVFGREHSGLTNDELERCHYLMNIPANPGYSSLNLAAAVQVVAYELMMTQTANRVAGETTGEDLATATELSNFYDHLHRVVLDIGFLDPDSPRQLMRRLKLLFNRARPDKTEINILRGILTAVEGVNRARGSGGM
ncbi:MAG: tRNA (cytidine32/uridine32-2'-O)-methyltransferase [Gammaproteobacteria bacterium]|nr:MAG: tRNA (cytidine32/uridine32-2'-O)-methyltransferase [Gammaproteobacteria bacterium]TND03226.1 MAG: tRNA (cytidine32/uridine32-2'-O)-methyltransferase [Gammaproteobacteria bacterium]